MQRLTCTVISITMRATQKGWSKSRRLSIEHGHSDHSNPLTPKTVLSRADSASVCDVALPPRGGDIGEQFFEPVHRHRLYQMVIKS